MGWGKKGGAKGARSQPVLRGTTNNTLRLIECCGCVAFPTFSSSVPCKTNSSSGSLLNTAFISLVLHSEKFT